MIVNGLEIKITRSQRKTVSIFVERDGTVSALVPKKLSKKEIENVVLAKEYQIHKNIAQWEQLNEGAVLREFVNGQSFLYLGRNYGLTLVEESLGEVQFVKGRFLLSKQEVEQARAFFIEFYKNKLKQKLQPLVKRYQKQLGVSPAEIKVMELQNRWASCSAKGNVHFHWKCAMAPMEVLQYIVAHELTHLIHLNHTPEFWNELDKIIPNYEKQLNWLKLNGAGMDL